MRYELHPLCTLFPRLEGAEFDALRDDIQANGLQQPIVLHEGRILDGGNRYRACVEAGVEPIFEEFTGGNLVAFVLSRNLHRRHMTPGQQAAIVASAQDWAGAQSHGGPRGNQHAAASQDATLHLATTADRAAQSGASVRTQKMADKVAKADPELARQVAQGEVSLPKAVEQVKAQEQRSTKTARGTTAAPADSTSTNTEHVDASSIEEAQDELLADHERLLADNQMMARVFEADDRLAAAMAEIARLEEENRVLLTRVNGLINEKDAAVKSAKAFKRKLDALEKRLGAA